MKRIGTEDAIYLFQERHVISIIMFLSDAGPCRKGDIYEAVSRGTRMPDKLECLQDMGLIDVETLHGSTVLIDLTEKGRKVSDLVKQIQALIGAES